jgi:hypothetical protein
MRSETPELSKEVTGRTEGLRATCKQERWQCAAAAQSLAGPYILRWTPRARDGQSRGLSTGGDKPDQISANRAIYDQANSIMTFLGSVKIETKTRLRLIPKQSSITKRPRLRRTDHAVAFTRENLSGSSTGAVLDGKTKILELKRTCRLQLRRKLPTLLSPSRRMRVRVQSRFAQLVPCLSSRCRGFPFTAGLPPIRNATR